MSSRERPRHVARRRGRRGVRAGALLVLGFLALGGGVATGVVVTDSVAAVTDKLLPTTPEAQGTPAGLPEALPEVEDYAFPADPVLVDYDSIGADGLSLADRTAGLLSTATPLSATGNLVVVPGSQEAPNPDAREVRTVRVEVEAGLEVNPQAFADFVMATLNDPRGWGGDGSVSFARTDGVAHIRVVLATPDKVDAMCAPLRTRGIYSCGRSGHAAINHTRWVEATPEFADRTQYRQYVVNHEVGHLLGKQHVSCPGDGKLAPLMQQQTIRVSPCLPNAWAFPGA